MVKALKKINLSLIIGCLLFFTICLNVKADTSGSVELLHELEPTSNFFTQVEDKSEIEIIDKRDSLLVNGYTKAIENDYLIVYYQKKTCGIAVYDKQNGYTWYSTYDNMASETLTPAVKTKIESGVTIEYYVVDTKGNIQSKELSYGTRQNNKLVGSSEMNIVDKASEFDIDVSFTVNNTKRTRFDISFKVEIKIDKDKLTVNVPYESIKEELVKISEEESLNVEPSEYRLKSITLFPYFGSENYKINGYSFIPDGSGALIRYSKDESSTAYVKKLYDSDYSFTDYVNNSYVKDNGCLNLPIFGINHGYNQASFLCEATSGLGSIELHSYPYKYSSVPVNTTFFKYYVRDTFTVILSQSTMSLLNDDPYPSDYSFTYSFLNGENANYVGMANCYRESLGLTDVVTKNTNIPLRLELLGIDYKPGLFGKNYVTMTTYRDALDIIIDLEDSGVVNFNITYLGWNRGGYFNKGGTTARSALLLGGKQKLLKLTGYIDDKKYKIDFTINPYVTTNYGFGSKTVKKIGLSPFEVTQKSSLEQTGYYVLPTELANIISSKSKRYNKLTIDGFNLANINVAYSYRYKSEAVYRSQMINEVATEVSKLATSYILSAEKPNSYLLPYMSNYYDAYYESNKFIYETDSIPFMSLLLGGSVTQYMPNINYVSDYDLAVLRMIEYNLYPSFILTKEEAYKLRYTNYEYLNSTEYSLWKDLIVKMYKETNNALKNVIDARMCGHEYIQKGVCKCTYNNGVVIYVNYNNENVNCDGVSLAPYSYLVKGGN